MVHYQIVLFKETNILLSRELIFTPDTISRIASQRPSCSNSSSWIPIKKWFIRLQKEFDPNFLFIFGAGASYFWIQMSRQHGLESNLFAQFIKMLLDTKWDTRIRLCQTCRSCWLYSQTKYLFVNIKFECFLNRLIRGWVREPFAKFETHQERQRDPLKV